MSQYAHLSTPDPEFLELVSKLPGSIPAPGPIDVASQRQAMRAIVVPRIMETLRPDLPAESSYDILDRNIVVDGGEILVRCIRPVPREHEGKEFPILVWFHGGGWISGELDIDDFALRILSVEFRISVVNVDYRLAPEHRFPTALDDCYAALKWTVNNAAEIAGSPTKGFLVGGASSGAHCAAVIAHRTRGDPFFNSFPLTGHILQLPSTSPRACSSRCLMLCRFVADLLSMDQNKDAPFLSKANIEFFCECLQVMPANSEFSPLLLSHENLAPAYIQVTGLDPLRDEGLLYERLLRESGVKTKLDIYPGVPHAFHRSFPELSASRKWEADFRAGLSWLLSGP
ncbi:Alpha/Beta hydrolase protein [Mycena rosella]|uniref:Alpha/Beta hydrolase protein n=1 Tax=Mycena rosella TaxID=1033263 RepID=A0AAD7H2J4_MYCRO|nr:Alpha/Beta hydrolase protein [Mycena rosella]